MGLRDRAKCERNCVGCEGIWENRIRALMSEAPKRLEWEKLKLLSEERDEGLGLHLFHPCRWNWMIFIHAASMAFSLRAQARLHKIQRNFSLTNATLYSDFKGDCKRLLRFCQVSFLHWWRPLWSHVVFQLSTAQIFVLTVVFKSVCHVD
jgi:hypothetical protein